MSYWWQDIILKHKIKGQTILKFTGEGCQARDEFNWVGKIIGFEKGPIHGGNGNKEVEYVIIEIIKHNFSYHDSRDGKEPELYKHPLVNADIQNVNGVWILFT